MVVGHTVAAGCSASLARCFSISFASAGIASMTFFLAPSRIRPYIFLAVVCEVLAARLSVTDARAERTSHTTAKKMYGRMRDGAKRNVVEAIPALGRMIEKHLAETPRQPAATA